MSKTTIKLRDQNPGETCYHDPSCRPTFAVLDRLTREVIASLPPQIRETVCLLEVDVSISMYRRVMPDQLLPDPPESLADKEALNKKENEHED